MSGFVKILESAACKCLHQGLINLGIQTNSVDPNYVCPDLVPNCLQRLSADDTWRQRVNVILLYIKRKALRSLIKYIILYNSTDMEIYKKIPLYDRFSEYEI